MSADHLITTPQNSMNKSNTWHGNPKHESLLFQIENSGIFALVLLLFVAAPALIPTMAIAVTAVLNGGRSGGGRAS